MTLEERVARLEAQQNLATKADLTTNVASLASGIGNDLRDIREDITGLHDDLRAIRQELAGIRELLERRTFHWPWERPL